MRYVSGDHYFSPSPGVTARDRQVAFTAGGRTFRLLASSGVFSANRLDPGTAVLLRKAPLPSGAETLLDLGCGYGAIACVLATVAPQSTVYATDVNERALELTATNAEHLKITVHTDVPDGVAFDGIWSNPPIRVGKAELHALLDLWLPRLRRDGTAWLVVARHLGADSLHRWLVERGWAAERHASQQGYRVLQVRRRETG